MVYDTGLLNFSQDGMILIKEKRIEIIKENHWETENM